ncbi:30S ribosomal protein S9 [Candidatus Micrarchaeota archaeon]|nr:30S ribosomal protein S9 [Candidatus Micrarchaeota archaeon]
MSIARATVVPGKGIVRVNSLNVDSFNNKYLKGVIVEPLKFIGPELTKVDIHVNVNGGGMMGRAQAARTAIANALVQYFVEDVELEKKMLEFDRSLLIADARRKIPEIIQIIKRFIYGISS